MGLLIDRNGIQQFIYGAPAAPRPTS